MITILFSIRVSEIPPLTVCNQRKGPRESHYTAGKKSKTAQVVLPSKCSVCYGEDVAQTRLSTVMLALQDSLSPHLSAGRTCQQERLAPLPHETLVHTQNHVVRYPLSFPLSQTLQKPRRESGAPFCSSIFSPDYFQLQLGPPILKHFTLLMSKEP